MSSKLRKKWVESTNASTSIESFPRGQTLDQEEKRMKFNEDMIVKCNSVNGKEVFVGTRNMQFFLKMNLTMRGVYNRMTNVADAHTCTIGGVNLILAMVLLT